ncbi:NAD(P)/FAD-dependent oxidoreductase [Mycobacterium sp. 155]|uniref:NAD(P)/FAD-dependent oxidoreductase n=1 Tax=Mycobacterium sp. 155 TaxID=1157943 RepID=UPI00037AF003|nr:FAD-dependent oxidoreductase [Mycobacterium sp. 155]
MSCPTSVVVVGASLAGLSTVRELRAAGYQGPVTVIGDEPHMPYDRPPLSKEYLTGQPSIELAESDDIDALQANWVLGRAAVGLTSDASGGHTVTLDDGSTLTAEAVVLATGARARSLPGCRPLPGVHTLRTVDDARALRGSLENARRLVVVGAGFIGAEVASTAASRGVEVTVVEMSTAPLVGVLGEEVATACTALHGLNDVTLLTGVCVSGVTGEERVTGVVLDDGTELAADVVVVGIGAIPNTEWLTHSEIAVENGFRTDDGCRTGAPGVYAVGDCATSFNVHLGAHHRSEHWTNATQQARVVASAILGAPQGPPAAPYFWSKQYGRQLQFAGHRQPGDTVRFIDGDPGSASFVALYERDGVATAVFAMDNPRLFTRHRKLIERQLAEQVAARTAAAHTAGFGADGLSDELAAT